MHWAADWKVAGSIPGWDFFSQPFKHGPSQRTLSSIEGETLMSWDGHEATNGIPIFWHNSNLM